MLDKVKKKRGLTLAKFAPFHVGHETLIRAALREVDELIVIMYDCPDITTIPLNVRASWIRKLYPTVKVIEGWDAPNRHEDTPEVRRMQEEYVIKVLNAEKIDLFFSAEYYGEHISKAIGATNRFLVREGISGTEIRKNVFINRHCVNKFVYKDLLTKVAFISLPSKNLRDIIAKVSKKMGSIFLRDCLFDSISEFINKKSKEKILSFCKKINFVELAERRIELFLSDSIFSANKLLFSESIPLMDHIISLRLSGNFNQELLRQAEDNLREYDIIFVCNIIKGESNIFGLDEKSVINQIIGNLLTNKIKYVLLEGSPREIIEKATSYLNKHHASQKV